MIFKGIAHRVTRVLSRKDDRTGRGNLVLFDEKCKWSRSPDQSDRIACLLHSYGVMGDIRVQAL